MSWLDLKIGPISNFRVSEKVTQNEHNKRVYDHNPACMKTPILMKINKKRVRRAEAHKYWTKNDQINIIWAYET